MVPMIVNLNQDPQLQGRDSRLQNGCFGELVSFEWLKSGRGIEKRLERNGSFRACKLNGICQRTSE